MTGTRSWKWAVVAFSIAALMSVGCAKKQTVKTEGAQAPSAGTPSGVTEAPVAEAPARGAAPATPATPPGSRLPRRGLRSSTTSGSTSTSRS